MANIHSKIQRPQFDRPELSHIEESTVDKVEQLNDRNYQHMLSIGYSEAEAKDICHQMPKLSNGISYYFQNREDEWN